MLLSQIYGSISGNVSFIIAIYIFFIDPPAPSAKRPQADREMYYVSACTVIYLIVSYSLVYSVSMCVFDYLFKSVSYCKVSFI